MAEIRSTLEIALEKADKLGRLQGEQMQAEVWVDRGRRVAVQFLKEEDTDLRKLIGPVDPQGLQGVLSGTMDVLLRNVILPRTEDQWPGIKRALKGVMEIKGSAFRTIVQQVEQLLTSYERTRNNYYEQLKIQMEGRLGGFQQAVAQQYGRQMAERIDAEALPQFQQEWSKLSAELTEQFQQQLDAIKETLRGN